MVDGEIERGGQHEAAPNPYETDMLVSEFASDHQGSLSPFGDVSFPLPVSRLRYQHPSAADRPHLVADELREQPAAGE